MEIEGGYVFIKAGLELPGCCKITRTLSILYYTLVVLNILRSLYIDK